MNHSKLPMNAYENIMNCRFKYEEITDEEIKYLEELIKDENLSGEYYDTIKKYRETRNQQFLPSPNNIYLAIKYSNIAFRRPCGMYLNFMLKD